MAVSLKLRRRLRTIKNLNSIFNALQVITTARLQKIKEKHRYAQHFLESFEEMSQDFDLSRFNKSSKAGKALAILISPNRGFCGAFNANLFYRTQNFIREAKREVEFIAFGRKGLEFLKAKKQYVAGSYLAEDYDFRFFAGILDQVLQRWDQEEVSETYLIYNHFRTVMRQDAVSSRTLPAEFEPARSWNKYIVEPEREAVAEKIFKYRLAAQLYFAYLDSQLGELSSRLFTMKGAIENSKELIDALVLNINKERQQSVTRELLEIIGATEGLKEEETF